LIDVPPALGVQVWDHDDGDNDDDLIGETILELGTEIQANRLLMAIGGELDVRGNVKKEKWELEGWFDITNSKKGKATGKVQLKILWHKLDTKVVTREKSADSERLLAGSPSTEEVVPEIDVPAVLPWHDSPPLSVSPTDRPDSAADMGV